MASASNILNQQSPWGLIERCLLVTGISFITSYFFGWMLTIGSFGLFLLLLAIGVPLITFISYLTVTPEGKAIFVTGCDTGFGNALAKHLHSLGYVVFAGCFTKDSRGKGAVELEKEGEKTQRLFTVQLDVSSQESVTKAAKEVEQRLPKNCKGVWGIVNNAGWSTFGEVEWVPMDVYEKVASINLFGTMRVTKAFLPLIRVAKGRVVNVASILGRMGAPMRSPYCASKWGVEGFSECLRFEMRRWGVNVSVIEPGNYIAGTALYTKASVDAQAKNMWENMPEVVKDDYGKAYFDAKIDQMHGYTATGSSTIAPVIEAMTDALTRTFPSCRYQPMQLPEKIKVYVATHLPELVFDYIYT
ncbi:D-beta-hydroxybutyrate dehydrogenase, mitochondrial-like isoform X4 [Artemia franciscana]|uniref:D-beta-hydroxybutyrate dehydrogenase, mitochondrial-like isoform X3 n=1 Tax=Artemia franciscana TaxID=6661 RepID=UPI0032D9BB6D